MDGIINGWASELPVMPIRDEGTIPSFEVSDEDIIELTERINAEVDRRQACWDEVRSEFRVKIAGLIIIKATLLDVIKELAALK